MSKARKPTNNPVTKWIAPSGPVIPAPEGVDHDYMQYLYDQTDKIEREQIAHGANPRLPPGVQQLPDPRARRKRQEIPYWNTDLSLLPPPPPVPAEPINYPFAAKKIQPYQSVNLKTIKAHVRNHIYESSKSPIVESNDLSWNPYDEVELERRIADIEYRKWKARGSIPKLPSTSATPIPSASSDYVPVVQDHFYVLNDPYNKCPPLDQIPDGHDIMYNSQTKCLVTLYRWVPELECRICEPSTSLSSDEEEDNK